MSRSFTYSALVLRVRPVGESNREGWFLTAEEGIVRAALFGGPKSRLRGYVAPFHQGTLWVYHDPVRDSRKVTDFDVQNWRPGIREAYPRAQTAGAVVETILASYGGGGAWPGGLSIGGGALDALDTADSAACGRILLHFLWNWLDLLGLREEILRCPVCGSLPGVLLYRPAVGTLRCPDCAGADAGGIPIGLGARRWLAGVEAIPPGLLSRYTLDAAAFGQAKTLVTGLAAQALGKRLESWGG